MKSEFDAVLDRFAELVAEKIAAKLNGSEPEQPDRLLTVREVARRLGVSPRYVYSRVDKYPFARRIGAKTLRFSERGLERWLARTK
jgi:excisionase family DNA binding protein